MRPPVGVAGGRRVVSGAGLWHRGFRRLAEQRPAGSLPLRAFPFLVPGDQVGEQQHEPARGIVPPPHINDALFAGHVHAYERTLPVAEGGKVDERCGIPYIVIGDGGNREGLAGDYVDPTPAWSAFREASYGHGTIDVLNTTHALFQWRRNQDDGAVADAAWIVTRKGRGCE